MNKWIIVGVLVILLVMTSISVFVIHSAVVKGEDVPHDYIEAGLHYSPLTEITEAKHYFGTEHYVVLFGKDVEGEDIVVWISEDLSILRHAWMNQAYNQEQLYQQIDRMYNPQSEIRITPGIENDLFLWEVIFQNSRGEFTYLYFDFFSGDLLRSITLKNR